MNKNYNIKCLQFLSDLDFKHYKPILNKNGTKLKTSNSKKYKKLLKQCIKYKKTKKRRCNLEEYINFSGLKKNNLKC
jgi:hypothetical protein